MVTASNATTEHPPQPKTERKGRMARWEKAGVGRHHGEQQPGLSLGNNLSKWVADNPHMGTDLVRVYRGLNVSPAAYNPTQEAKAGGKVGGRWYTPKDLWVHRRLSGAISYASGFMGHAKSRGPKASSVILEFQLPADKLAWSDPERATFSRRDVRSDREFLSRVGILRTRPTKTMNPVEQIGAQQNIEWMRPEDFFLHRRRVSRPGPGEDESK